MKIANILATSVIIPVTFTISAWAQTPAQSLSEGHRLYTINCANCHGDVAQGAVKAGIELSIITERGGKQPPNLTDEAWDHGSTDAEILNTVKKGFPSAMMPPFEGVCPTARLKMSSPMSV